MLGHCRAANSLLQLSFYLGNVQLGPCPPASHLANLLVRLTSGLTGSTANSEQRQRRDTDTEELAYFDEPSELERSLTATTSVQQPTAAEGNSSSHLHASSSPHSLADLADAGASVEQQVYRSLDQISTSRNVKQNLRHLVQISTRAGRARTSAALAAPSHIQDTGSISAAGSPEEAQHASQAIAEAVDSTQEHLINNLDSAAFAEATEQQKQQQRRLLAQRQALAALRDLWQQAEPPVAVRGHELEVVHSYDALLRLCGQFKQFLQQEQQQTQQQQPLQQQQPHEQLPGQPQSLSSKGRRKATASMSSSVGSASSAGTAGHPAETSRWQQDYARIRAVLDTELDMQQTLEIWGRTRQSVLSGLKVRQLVDMFKLAGWPLPDGKIDPKTNKKKGVTKPDYIQALLKREKGVVETLLAQRIKATAR